MKGRNSAQNRNGKEPEIMSTPQTDVVQPYLFFNGRCEEALEFYKKNLGAEVTMLMRYKDSPEPNACGPVSPDKVMHATFRIGSTNLFASDGNADGKVNFQGFALSLSVATEAEADRRFKALANGGQVQMPLSKTFFSPRFGMVTDRFGLKWMVIVAMEPVGANRK
jgi:PhnB protein